MHSSSNLGVKRIVFYQILEGDRRKAVARSNDEPSSGGGARDLRFPREFWDVLVNMFSNATTRKRNGAPIQVYTGAINWLASNSQEHTTTLEVWPPTVARHRELRLARIHEIEAFANIPNAPIGNLFLFLVQDYSGVVRLHYGDEALLKSDDFNQEVATQIFSCADSLSENKRVMGYMDREKGTNYCHGQ